MDYRNMSMNTQKHTNETEWEARERLGEKPSPTLTKIKNRV